MLAENFSASLAVAFSGGGDSTALLSLMLEKAKDTKITALIVDHGLREGSADEAKLAAKRAQDMGAGTEILTWQGEKPETGIQEKARLARYGLLGAACRRLGIDTLLLGHNEDDQAETIWMRQKANSGWRGLAGMKEKAKAPLWPQLFGITLERPLLGVTRAQLRDYNKKNNLPYIDDPSNENRAFTRIQARDALRDDPALRAELLEIAATSRQRLQNEQALIFALINEHVQFYDWGGVRLPKKILSHKALREALKYLCLAVSGSAMPPSLNKLKALSWSIGGKGFRGSTLGGAQFINEDDHILIVRDPGMVTGRKGMSMLAPLMLSPNVPAIWDGRFVVKTAGERVSVLPLLSAYDQVSKQDFAGLKTMPFQARSGIPAFERGGILLSALLPNESAEYEVKCVIKERLASLLS